MALAEIDLRYENLIFLQLRMLLRDRAVSIGADAALPEGSSHTACMAEKACEIIGSWRLDVRQAKLRSQVSVTL
jgi:hypothetical protein